jgi:hypothetical protein
VEVEVEVEVEVVGFREEAVAASVEDGATAAAAAAADADDVGALMLFIGGLPPLWNTDTGATAALLANTLAAASAEGPSAAEEEEGAAAAAAAADSSASAAVNEDRSGECGGGAGRAASAIARGFVLSEGHDACYLSCARRDRVRVRRNGRECPSPESRRRLVEVYYFGASPKTSSPFIFSLCLSSSVDFHSTKKKKPVALSSFKDGLLDNF